MLPDTDIFLNFFFSNRIPKETQREFREAFEFAKKTTVDEAPDAFKQYVSQHCQKDPQYRSLLEQAASWVERTTEEKPISGRPISDVERLSSPQPQLPVGLVYTAHSGYLPILKSIKDELAEFSENPPVLNKRQYLNLHLNSKVGSICSNHDGVQCVVQPGTEIISLSKEGYLLPLYEDVTIPSRLRYIPIEKELKRNRISLFRTETGEELPIVAVGTSCHSASVIIGCLIADAEGRVNDKSLIVQGISGGAAQLRLAACEDFFLYPQQLVSLVGLGESGSFGNVFTVHRVFSGLSPPSLSPLLGADGQYGSQNVHVRILSGAFTAHSNLQFQLLDRKIKQALADRPHLLVILGPIVPIDHSCFSPVSKTCLASADLQIVGSNGDVEWCSFNDLYAKAVDTIQKVCPRSSVVFVPSTEDLAHQFPIPQPPYDFQDISHSRRTMCVGNPAAVIVNECRMLITTADPFRPVMSNHTRRRHASDPHGNILDKICDEILRQRTLFPTDPHEVIMESDKSLHLNPAEYEIILVQSTLTPFCRIVHDRIFINCGRSASGKNHTDIFILPPGDEKAFHERVKVAIYQEQSQ